MSVLEILDVARQAAGGSQPPPSWFPDPTERHEHRWWDGERWTANVADHGQPGVDDVALGQEAPDWRTRMAAPAIADRRAETLMARYGITHAELAGLEAEAGLLLWHREQVPDRIRLMRTPREQLTGGVRNTQTVLLNGRNADLLARGEVVALVHCKRCRAVVALGMVGDLAGHYCCAAGHKFHLDDVTLSAPADVAAWQATLAAQPPRKGVRF